MRKLNDNYCERDIIFPKKKKRISNVLLIAREVTVMSLQSPLAPSRAGNQLFLSVFGKIHTTRRRHYVMGKWGFKSGIPMPILTIECFHF